ncbi:Na(+)-translocating NADH-quinone reductase subunit A [uncultured Paracoccus sp.]|uniref:Na(+)-translocating NADH-quinone reductase subunit A n=1 Tax=uncultured Paracoccus sp. TaxID=189685 RepID=UPI0026342239|nr:Na(+)-translocating NADH-quinone reductase subunit A [uncultured Paracoccus sp.]
MRLPARRGLTVPVGASPAPDAPIVTMLSDEAAVQPAPGEVLRVAPLVAAGDIVAAGAPLARLRHAPEITLTAPMPARVAAVDLAPGRILSRILLFHEPGADRTHLDVSGASDAGGLRDLLLASGAWRLLRRRPFGRMPPPGERPAAIFVMAVDSRPAAPDPLRALEGAEADLDRGLAGLAMLTDGPVLLCLPVGADPALGRGVPRLRRIEVGDGHPLGLAGMQVHALHPARGDRPVWDLHVEDAAAIGGLLRSGSMPETRLVSVAGDALRAGRLVRTQPGAHLGALSRDLTRPGPHSVLSGSALDGHEAGFLGPRDRQVTVLVRRAAARPPHWFVAALGRASRPRPLIPTAALEQALGGSIPAAPILRALAAGDAETAQRLGALSLVEEDLALADYVTGAVPRFSALLRVFLDRAAIEHEGAEAA